MRNGFVKVCAVTPELKVADIKFNTERIKEGIRISSEKGSQLTVFPELSITGYTCGDLFNQKILLDSVERALDDIAKFTKGNHTLVFVGAPLRCYNRLYNCAVAISDGRILGVVPKTCIPNYGEFYERRHFLPAPDTYGEIKICGICYDFYTNIIFKAENFENFTVSAELCEDLWSPVSPSAYHAKAGANIIVNLSCSDETVGKAEYRKNLVKIQSGKLVSGYVYADAGNGESTTDMVFAGHNLIAENGNIISESKLFDEGLLFGEIDVDMLSSERQRMSSGYYQSFDNPCGVTDDNEYVVIDFVSAEGSDTLARKFSKTPFVPSDNERLRERTELILNLQSKGLEKRLAHTNAKTAVIGISGGLDSALAFLVTCRAFKSLNKPIENVIAVTMPGFGTTNRTKSNSIKLIELLGATAKVIPITDSVLQHFKDIDHDPAVLDVTYENSQARMRTMILMDIANKTGGMVIGTGDLSELALGWATYNGDHMSMYGVNSSIPKTLVKHLIAFEADRLGGECRKVLTDILNTEISPELLPPSKNGDISQKTEDLVGPYVLHDFFLYHAIRWGEEPEKVLFLACNAFEGVYDRSTIKKWLVNFYKRFFAQQFKRSCLPDGVKVGSVTLSPRGDWRMPSDASVKVWLDNIEDSKQ
jgi:NAD+ synthase (glutamine-hydrolysing)